MEHNYRVKLRWLIFVATVLRCIFALLIELGTDETYYYTYALQLDWNHFDHPPLLGLLIRFFTLNLNWVNDFSMRLGPIFLAAVNTWLIAKIATSLMNARAGLIAAILFTTSIFASIISGILILPDSIANTFWLAALYFMLQILKDPTSANTNYFLLLGLSIGLACLSKVHAVFLWFGFLAYIVFHQRVLLRRKALYLGLAISVICILPILYWNYQHDFITWKFHSERVSILESGLRLDFFFQTFFGQIFYNNPLLVYLYAVMLLQLYKHRGQITSLSRHVVLLLLYCGLPIILMTSGLSLFRQTLPHWSGPGFFSLMLLTALWMEKRLELNSIPRCRKILNTLLSFTLGIMILAVLLIRYYPGNLTGRSEGMKLGREDVTLDMWGWKDFQVQFASIRQQAIERGEMSADAPIVVHNWFPGGHLLYYVARPLGMGLLAEGNLQDIHKFAWLNGMQNPVEVGGDAYFIAPSNVYEDPEVLYGDFFREIRLSKVLEQKRGSQVVRKWYVYELKGATKVVGRGWF